MGPGALSLRARGQVVRCTPGAVVLPASATHSAGLEPRPTPPIGADLRNRGWRHVHELTSEATSPVMTSASPALCSGRNKSPVPSAAAQLLPPYSVRQRLWSFRAYRGGPALADFHQSRVGFLIEATPPLRSTNHEAPSASPASVMWAGLAGRGPPCQPNLREAGGVLAAGVSGLLA